MSKQLNIAIEQKNGDFIFITTEYLREEVLKSIQKTLKNSSDLWTDELKLNHAIISNLYLDLKTDNLGVGTYPTDTVFLHINTAAQIIRLNEHNYHYNEFAYGNLPLMLSEMPVMTHVKTQTQNEQMSPVTETKNK